ncbi:MAG: Fic family protein [Bacilli bacterium]|nr:Fic family protein [Bacilli bacterium]
MEKKYLKYCVKTGIGLQDVDGLTVSDKYKEVSEKYINGDVSFEEAYKIITDYYANKRDDETINQEDKPDLVSLNIANILANRGFVFTVGQLLSIHKILFTNVYEHAGKFREFNFSKKEWVLNGESVYYADYREIQSTLEYDFSVERQYNYSNKSIDEIIDHLATFIANLWQIHPFQEGNTRTTAIFTIKYLQTLGFDVTNDTFANNAWYFRNSLVRANYSNINKGIFVDKSFLVIFLNNLLKGEKNTLENKLLSVNITKKETNSLNNLEEQVLKLIKGKNNITSEEISSITSKSLRTIKTVLMELQNKKIIKRMNGKRYGHWKVK